jgi:hypothetical protein
LAIWTLYAPGIAMKAPASRRRIAGLEIGEILCDAYDAFLVCYPTSVIDFEQFVLLTEGVRIRRNVRLNHCQRCRALVLTDVLADPKPLCASCLDSRPRKVAKHNDAHSAPLLPHSPTTD